MCAQAAERMTSNEQSPFVREVLGTNECRALMSASRIAGTGEHEFPAHVMLYRYTSTASATATNGAAGRPWVLCIGTLGKQGSQTFSLGGFRIVPEDRERATNFTPEKEAIGLACGMEEKVYWSRLIRVAGPLGLKHLDQVVGGKCVLLPSSTSRVGQPNDIEMLRFAVAALADFETHSGVHVTTGQDLGHGMLSDGKTSSLEFLHEHFHGSVVSDTSGPTAEGNLYTLFGMLRGVGIDPKRARIGMIGFGNIGKHLVRRLEETLGSEVLSRLFVVESGAEKRKMLEQRGVKVFSLDQKAEFLIQAFDALVLNASAGSLDKVAVDAVIANKSIRVLCGCENLVMPDANDAERLRINGKQYCPTELCGMMGYLTAVEEYFSRREGREFKMQDILGAAKKLEEASYKAATRAEKSASKERLSFEDAMREEFAA